MAITADQVNRLETILSNLLRETCEANANTRWLMNRMETRMAEDFSKLQTALDLLNQDVNALKGVADTAVTALRALQSTVAALNAQIATLQAGSPTNQATIDALTTSATSMATQIEAAQSEIVAAMPPAAPAAPAP